MKEIAVFAQTTFRNQARRFGIKTDDRRRHMYLIGKTGMGKSTILENMIVGDIRAGFGVAVVDPHGDLAEKIMEYIPSDRIHDVIYFNPSDIDFPIAFNIVEQVEPHLRHLVASGLIGVFQKLWADSWGPRLEYILRNAILAILDFPGSTILGVVRMLSDKNYRKQVVTNIKDPVVKAFWEREFSGYADKFASEAVSPIQNKVGQFLSSSLMRNIIGQVKSSIDIREVMDSGKILIMNLSKGRIGEDNSALLGAMMITKIQLAAMSRVDVPEGERKDFYLYIDEFQNFSTDSFANILSEARKYRLNLILAHQYIEQLSEKVKPAVFGNVGTMIVFRVGAADAEELVKEFTPTFTEEDIVNLPKYEMYLKLMIDGIASSPFSAKGLPPLTLSEKTGNTDKVINYSREKYAGSRVEIEEKIARWHEIGDEGAAKKTVVFYDKKLDSSFPLANSSVTNSAPSFLDNNQEARLQNLNNINQRTALQVQTQKNNNASFPANCSACGIKTFLAFEPDGIRPVYCKDCLSKKREEKRLEQESRKNKKVEERQAFAPKEFLQEIRNELKAGPQSNKNQARFDSGPKISLNDLKNIAPVDFKGRSLKPQNNSNQSQTQVQVQVKIQNQDQTQGRSQVQNQAQNSIEVTNIPSQELELKEGEEIKFE
ncbi:type IV secretion system DNA-binding domain-containing protein [Candidatus Falkowbacteria bacterium]|nr:type IV secretion system DNA-binding domain-containing protein [Candidatus Falkowbacteria bacterium]NCT54914.1 type IV secretion system DNA-binding domain-containing protein [Candidatus Falkowbacteria bacterium]